MYPLNKPTKKQKQQESNERKQANPPYNRYRAYVPWYFKSTVKMSLGKKHWYLNQKTLRWLISSNTFPIINLVGRVMVNVVASSSVDRGFESRSSQCNDYKIGNCCFSERHTSIRNKGKDWVARNQNNVSEWKYMTNRGQLFQCTSTIKI